MRIVFMGTPEFAVATLDKIHHSKHEVVGVVTAEDKPYGRNLSKISVSAVKKYAKANDLKILQPSKLRDPEFIEALKAFNADIFVVVAFRMLPEVVWSIPAMGTFNLHASLLPKYRGAAPINWAIVHGETQTGLTTFFIDKKIDTGKIIEQVKCPIFRTDNAGTLHDRMMPIGADLVLDTINKIENNQVEEFIQDEALASHAPKIFHQDCEIDPNWSVEYAYNFIRGMSPYPAAWTVFEDKKLKIFETSGPMSNSEIGLPESPLEIDKSKGLYLRFPDGGLRIEDLQLEGKRKMSAKDFLNGIK